MTDFELLRPSLCNTSHLEWHGGPFGGIKADFISNRIHVNNTCGSIARRETGAFVCGILLKSQNRQEKKYLPSVPMREQAEKEHVNFQVPSHIRW